MPRHNDSTSPSSFGQRKPPGKVVIAGAGITGLCTAYYLVEKYKQIMKMRRGNDSDNHHDNTITIVDVTGTVAPGASGKAAGFLAQDWNDGTATEELTRRSFGLHQALAHKLGAARIQYRRVTCVSATTTTRVEKSNPTKKKRKVTLTTTTTTKGPEPDTKVDQNDGVEIEWASVSNDQQSSRMTYSVMGDETTVAQVHPKLLCQALWEACETAGCKLVQGKVTGAVPDPGGNLAKVQLDDGSTTLPADVLVYACGPWVANIMYGIKGHSLVLPTPPQPQQKQQQGVLKQCVFFYTSNDDDDDDDDDNDNDSSTGDCEVFVRPDGTAFCSGFPDDLVQVDEFPGKEKVEPEKANRLLQAIRRNCSNLTTSLVSESSDATTGDKNDEEKAAQGDCIIVRQACYQPVTDDYLPVIGPLTRRASGCKNNSNGGGCYMAGGNNCWGILLGPATGECMADLIVTGKTPHVDISKFRPSRYRNLKPVPTQVNY